MQAAETESETEAETVYSQEDLELLNSLDQAEAEGVDGLDADSIDWGNAEIQVMEDEEVSNILLIGHGTVEEDRQRSDSIIICSVNKDKGEIILTSIMRDLYVPIPGYKDNRINAAYQFGGMNDFWIGSSRNGEKQVSTSTEMWRWTSTVSWSLFPYLEIWILSSMPPRQSI